MVSRVEQFRSRKVLVKNRKRNSFGGGILVLTILSALIILVWLILPCFDFVRLGLFRGRENSSLEAASLCAVNDVTKIVIDDRYFGFVALSDDTPTGLATIAQDQQPLPVWGINTVWATVRREMLIAQALDNDYLRSLAVNDLNEAQRATNELMTVIQASLKPNCRYLTKDKDGRLIKPYEHAKSVLSANTNAFNAETTPNTSDFKLTLGWLNEAADSCTAYPKPANLANLKKGTVFGDNYRAFVDVPVGRSSFFFAGFAKQAALVNNAKFRPFDGKRICSIVRADATFSVPANEQLKRITGQSLVTMNCSACAEPGANVDTTIPGIMRINFHDGLPSSIKSLNDLFINNYTQSHRNDLFTAVGGDYPLDPSAKLVVLNPQDKACFENRIFQTGFFDWVRSLHNNGRLDAIMQLVNSPFDRQSVIGSGSRDTPSFLYEFDKSGNLLITNEKETPFLNESVQQNQVYFLDFEAIQDGGLYWTVAFRDQVHNLGLSSGGKHAGEAMLPNPINWCELPFYDGNPDIALMKQKGSQSRGLIVNGSNIGTVGGNGAISADSAYFRNADNASLPVQPRKTYYSGGLAVEFKISSPAAPAQFF
jgi:hypothetical protein